MESHSARRHLKMALGHRKDVTLVYKVMSKKPQDINPPTPELHFTMSPNFNDSLKFVNISKLTTYEFHILILIGFAIVLCKRKSSSQFN